MTDPRSNVEEEAAQPPPQPPPPPFVLPSGVVSLGGSPFHVVQPDRNMVINLVGLLVARSGMSLNEVARRMGIKRQSLQQVIKGKIGCPSVMWLSRLAGVCGAQLVINMPGSGA